MLLLLIPIAWIAIATFFVLVCRGAAQADAMPGGASATGSAQPIERGALVALEDHRAARRRMTAPVRV
jgi:hypothetical protein